MALQVWAPPGPTGTFFKNVKLCQGLQEQHTSLTNARGTTALSTFTLGKGASCVSTPANLGWVAALSSTSRRIPGSRARLATRGWVGAADLPRHQARGNPIGLQETNRLKVVHEWQDLERQFDLIDMRRKIARFSLLSATTKSWWREVKRKPSDIAGDADAC